MGGPPKVSRIADISPDEAKWAQLGPDGPSWAQKGCRRAPESQIPVHFWRWKRALERASRGFLKTQIPVQISAGKGFQRPQKTQIPGQISDPRLPKDQRW